MSGSVCPHCGEPSATCRHYLGRIARIGGKGPGPRGGPLTLLASRTRTLGRGRLRDLADDAPAQHRDILDALADSDGGWWTRTSGLIAVGDSADPLAPCDWYVANPSVLGILESRVWDLLRWLDERDA